MFVALTFSLDVQHIDASEIGRVTTEPPNPGNGASRYATPVQHDSITLLDLEGRDHLKKAQHPFRFSLVSFPLHTERTSNAASYEEDHHHFPFGIAILVRPTA